MIFAIELTSDLGALPALLIGATVSFGLNVLVLKHSILTEKVARRGYHITQEYAVDPLEGLSVDAVMTRNVVTVPASLPVRDLLAVYFFGDDHRHHTGYPVVDKENRLVGLIMRSNLLENWVTGLFDGKPGATSWARGRSSPTT